MKRSFCAILLGLLLCSGYAQQQPNSQETPGKAAVSPLNPAIPATSPGKDPLSSEAGTSPRQASDETMTHDSAVQAHIQNAFDRDPVFSRGSVKVTTTGDAIELSGDVASGRDRLNAARIALSYARGKKVVNHIVVKGRAGTPVPNSPESQPANLGTPATNHVSSNSSPP